LNISLCGGIDITENLYVTVIYIVEVRESVEEIAETCYIVEIGTREALYNVRTKEVTIRIKKMKLELKF
jgi:hypothetical protein